MYGDLSLRKEMADKYPKKVVISKCFSSKMKWGISLLLALIIFFCGFLVETVSQQTSNKTHNIALLLTLSIVCALVYRFIIRKL